MTIKLLLADDHHIVREGFRMVLEAQPDFEVIAETSDGIETIRQVENLQPDVLILDLMMPILNGLEVARQVQDITKVLVLSMHDNEAYVLEALRNGAYGYVLKDATASELVKAVRQVAEGKHYLSSPFAEKAIEVYARLKDGELPDPYEELSNREREVLQLVAQGYSNPDIGDMLNISARTVEVHRAGFMKKLNFRNQADLIRFALEKGILPMERK